jgi:diguanylate cyclase (GGDEF)-like protein/PAS domain S-box-containing protein
MKSAPPARGLPPPPDGADAAATAEALETASHDLALDEPIRALLIRAARALQSAHIDAEHARMHYYALFDAVPDPVSILDADGIVLDLNKAGLRAYQRAREDIVGKPIHLINPDLPADHLQPVWETLDRGDTYVREVDNMRADGSRFPVEVHSANFRLDGRNCIVAVARDLSGRRDAELRYRALMENIDKAILVRDAEGRITHANLAARRLFGIRAGQRADRALADEHWLVVDEHGRELRADELPAARVACDGRAVHSTVLGFFHRQRRSLTWVSVTAMPQFLPGHQRPQQVLSMFSDVTALKRDSTLFARAQALARIGGWEWDTGRNHLYLTNEARRIIGRDQASDTIEGLLDCLIEADRCRLRQALEQTMSTGRDLQLELQGMRGDGQPFWVRAIGEIGVGSLLSARLTGTLQDITDRKRGEETLRVKARTDPLTGLLNRDALRFEIEARLADPAQSALAVLYIDLDRFKVVNDVLGHAAGDRLLAAAARRIQRAVGTEGLIARVGGAECLAVCAVDDDPARPPRLADRILEVFADAFRLDGAEFAITASIGIAQAPQDGTRSQQLIQSADVAMYASKRRGRNSWQVFTAELAAQQQQRQQLETQLRHAIDNNEFHLVYQPQVDLASGRVVAAEALIRWRNQSLGDMAPDHFIDHAETTGDIVAIGTWVMRQACRQLREWRDNGLQLERVAVNVSYRQFMGEDLAEIVQAALTEFDLPGCALELEFTERVLIEDEPDTLRTFTALRDLGVSLAIDDFGEGYSALNYLRRLPIHGLKLSQLFVQGIPDTASDVAVCEAIIGIARSLKLGLVAEGVENAAQRDFLIAQGVHVGQGFLFAPGLLPDELAHHYAGTIPQTLRAGRRRPGR